MDFMDLPPHLPDFDVSGENLNCKKHIYLQEDLFFQNININSLLVASEKFLRQRKLVGRP